jgi:hypothetical protein
VGNAVEKFYLDLDTILQRFHHSGELLGEIPAKKLGNRTPWRARLRVDKGSVTSCQIVDTFGAVIDKGDLALEALHKLGPLTWEVILDPLEGTGKLPVAPSLRKSSTLPSVPERPVPAPNQPPAPPQVPYRLVNVSLQQMNQTQWPREYRLVYVLVDGIRSSEKIAGMLAMPRPDVEFILNDLKDMRVIDLNP